MELTDVTRSLRWVPALCAVVLLTACGATTGGRAAAATTVSSATTGSATSTADTTSTGTEDSRTSETSTRADPEAGPARGTVDAIVDFTDPAEQIGSAADLTDYLLPGMSGDGVDCFAAAVDPDEILPMSFADGAEAVTAAVLDCIEPAYLGNVVAMYAVGLTENGAEWYERVSSCAADAMSEEPVTELRAGLESIFEARLDLNAPPTSPDIAFEFLAERSDCLMWLTDTTPAETPVETSAEVPGGPAEDRTVKWDLLRPGQCIVDLPDGDISEVPVTDCANPHESEVVGTDLPMTGTEQATCDAKFEAYTGRPYTEMPEFGVEYISATDTFTNPWLICLATSAGAPTTGSVAAG
jgi:hypothetical protein